MSDLVIENQEFKKIAYSIKKDILNTRIKVQTQANRELISLYARIGKTISENARYGNNFIEDLSKTLKLDFPNVKGFSTRNLARMRKFYEEYSDFSNLPPAVAKLPWTHNCILIDKVNNKEKRLWYANECLNNNWSKVVLSHQIELELYERQVKTNKLTNFADKLPAVQSELATDIVKDPYIFELEGIADKVSETEIEDAMVENIKNVLLEFGSGFSFVGNQYKVSTEKHDYYIDLLFYHLELRCYIVVELKTTEFEPDYIGQLNFYATAVDEILKHEEDNQTIGLLLCKEKDRLSVEWSLKSIDNPIGVSSYEVKNSIPEEFLEKLPSADEINKLVDNIIL